LRQARPATAVVLSSAMIATPASSDRGAQSGGGPHAAAPDQSRSAA
jgi:hypothetical protein